MREAERLRKLAPVAVAMAALGVAAVLLTWNPSAHAFPRCLFHMATGLYCPGCGCQRALHHLLQGDVRSALHFNLFVVLALPILLLGYVRWTLTTYGARWPFGWRAPAAWIWGFLAALLLYTALRNIPQYPFSLLAPPAS
jgi:hypothetical protein